MFCYSIRRTSWIEIAEEHPYLSCCLKINFLNFYNERIRLPLIKQYKVDIESIKRRFDFDQQIVLPDYTNLDILKLRSETFEGLEV